MTIQTITFYVGGRKAGETAGATGGRKMGGRRTQAVSGRIIRSGKFRKMTGYS